MSENPLYLALEINRSKFLLVLCIFLIAASLRTPITALSPMLELVREDISLSNTLAGFLTTLPLLAFAVFSMLVTKISKKYGMEMVVFSALAVIVIGGSLRPFGGLTWLMTGTLLIGLSIAVLNVILPGLIKQEFPSRLGMMTGMYTISMNLWAAVATALSVPLALNNSLGWRSSLGSWTILALVALLFWISQLKYSKRSQVLNTSSKISKSIWRSPLAWKVSVCMGAQSSLFYISIAWWPDFLQSQGMTSAQAGYVLSFMQFGLIPFTFFVPILADRMKNQRLLVIVITLLFLIGLTGMMLGTDHTVITIVSVLIFGIASGSSFGLVMILFSLRTKTGDEAADLSGMAQSIGYLIAACGPILFGFVHDVSARWTIPLMIPVVACLVFLITGLDACGNKFIHSETEKPRC